MVKGSSETGFISVSQFELQVPSEGPVVTSFDGLLKRFVDGGFSALYDDEPNMLADSLKWVPQLWCYPRVG